MNPASRYAQPVWALIAVAACSVSWGFELVPMARTEIVSVAEAPAAVQDLVPPPPGVDGYWLPTEKELAGVEDGLAAYLKSQHDPAVHDWSKYTRRVVGVTIGGVQCLCLNYSYHAVAPAEMVPEAQEVTDWRASDTATHKGDEGFFRVTYDLENRKFVWRDANVTAGNGLEDILGKGFAAVRVLQPMTNQEHYTLDTVAGSLTGRNDDFLRRRTGAQVIASGRSCGCGDNALAFVEAIRGEPVEVMLVEGAEVSSASFLTAFSGHVVVAVRQREGTDRPWALVDSTRLRIMAEPWSPEAKSFVSGGRFYWIGYCGSPEHYPTHSGAELRKALAAVLSTIPPTVVARHTVRMHFRKDRSMWKTPWELYNPRVAELDKDEDRLAGVMTDPSERDVEITLRNGGPDAKSVLAGTSSGRWAAEVGERSACSPSFVDYLERTVMKDEASAQAPSP